MTFKKSKEHALINKGSGAGYIVECDESGNQICTTIMRLPNESKLISKQGERYL